LKPRPFKSRGCSSLAVPIPQQLLEVPSDLASVQEVEDPSLEIEDPLVSAVKIVSPSYLGCNSSDIPANEEDLLRIVKFGRCKNKAMRELRNLNSSINYGKSNVSSRQGKGNGHVM